MKDFEWIAAPICLQDKGSLGPLEELKNKSTYLNIHRSIAAPICLQDQGSLGRLKELKNIRTYLNVHRSFLFFEFFQYLAKSLQGNTLSNNQNSA